VNKDCLKNDHEKYVLTQSIALLSRLGTKKKKKKKMGKNTKEKRGKKIFTESDKIYITNKKKNHRKENQ